MKKKSEYRIFEQIRKPTAPPTLIMKSRIDKRVKKFNYTNELEKY